MVSSREDTNSQRNTKNVFAILGDSVSWWHKKSKMGTSFFQFKQFTIHQNRCSMKVTTDSCLFGAWVAERINNETPVKNILDIGSGTGLLSLILAQKSTAGIDGIELQQKDYLQSCENIIASRWHDRINMIHTDAINYQFTKKYDVIISNPPFYENDLKSEAKGKNIAHHDDGLTLENLVNIIVKNLSSEGKFYLLLPEKRKADLLETIGSSALFINHIVEVHQTEKHSAFRIIAEGSFTKANLPEAKITIKEDGVYSSTFVRLLKDYYLHL